MPYEPVSLVRGQWVRCVGRGVELPLVHGRLYRVVVPESHCGGVYIDEDRNTGEIVRCNRKNLLHFSWSRGASYETTTEGIDAEVVDTTGDLLNVVLSDGRSAVYDRRTGVLVDSGAVPAPASILPFRAGLAEKNLLDAIEKYLEYGMAISTVEGGNDKAKGVVRICCMLYKARDRMVEGAAERKSREQSKTSHPAR